MEPSAYLYVSVLLESLGALYLMQKRKKKIKRRYWVRPWIRRRDSPTRTTMTDFHKELILDGDVLEFRSTLRMSPEIYHRLLDLLTPGLSRMYTNFRSPITPDTKLAITLCYLALGEGFRTLSQVFRVGITTTRMIVRETCRAVANLMQHKYLITPSTHEDWMQVALEYERKWHSPHCIGTLDGKHIRMTAPANSGTFFYNYKGFFSIVLLGIVDSEYKFPYVDMGSEGKASDGGIWAKCTFQQHLVAPGNPLNIPRSTPLPGIPQSIPYYLVGDDAFRLGANIMKPYPGGGLTRKQQLFNYRLCRCHRVVENAFGILACRFKVYQRTLEVQPDFVGDIVMATCILHNFLRQESSTDYIPSTAVDQELIDGDIIPGAWRQEACLEGMSRNKQKNASDYAKRIRNALSDYFLTPNGEVPWQYDHVFQ